MNVFLQSINNSTASKHIIYFSNLITIVHIVQNGKNGNADRRSMFLKFKTSKPL